MKILSKNLAAVEAPAIVMHGVNCQQTMQSGVAKALFTKWPQVREDYMSILKNEMVLGKISPINVDEKLFVINCWTQQNYGYDNKSYADVSAIKTCVLEVIKFSNKIKINNIYSSLIGCGLGGLSWEQDVKPIFLEAEEKHPHINITICYLN
jgi:O-acetyl-ADP-ribose deacetylase (regulator of RNase III)